MATVSVIIPVLNEQSALPRTLAALARQRGAREVIVCDGGSTDTTRDIVAGVRNAIWIEAPRGRANQMNAGAARARGQWLLFLHADTILPTDALLAITALPQCYVGGGFRHRFSGSDWRLRFISFLHNWRCGRTRIVYGDQAMFVRRAAFEAVGGFPPTPILEDIMISEQLQQIGPLALLRQHVITDSRKFEKMGIWRSLARVVRILVAYELRRAIPAQEFFSDIR